MGGLATSQRERGERGVEEGERRREGDEDDPCVSEVRGSEPT